MGQGRWSESRKGTLGSRPPPPTAQGPGPQPGSRPSWASASSSSTELPCPQQVRLCGAGIRAHVSEQIHGASAMPFLHGRGNRGPRGHVIAEMAPGANGRSGRSQPAWHHLPPRNVSSVCGTQHLPEALLGPDFRRARTPLLKAGSLQTKPERRWRKKLRLVPSAPPHKPAPDPPVQGLSEPSPAHTPPAPMTCGGWSMKGVATPPR